MRFHVQAPTPEQNVWDCIAMSRRGEGGDYLRVAAYLMWVDSEADLSFREYLEHWRIEF